MSQVPAEFSRFKIINAAAVFLQKENQPTVSAVLKNYFLMQCENVDPSTLSPEAEAYLNTLRANIPELSDTAIQETRQYVDNLFDELNLYLQVDELKPDMPLKFCICQTIYDLFEDDEAAKRVRLCMSLASQAKAKLSAKRQNGQQQPSKPVTQEKPVFKDPVKSQGPQQSQDKPVFKEPVQSQGPPTFTPPQSQGPPSFTPPQSQGPPSFTPPQSQGPPSFTPPQDQPVFKQTESQEPPVFNQTQSQEPPVFTIEPPVFTPTPEPEQPVLTPNPKPEPTSVTEENKDAKEETQNNQCPSCDNNGIPDVSTISDGSFDISAGIELLDSEGYNIQINIPEIGDELTHSTIKSYLNSSLSLISEGNPRQALCLLEEALSIWSKSSPQ